MVGNGVRREPTRAQWEDCKVCGGDHWTKDHPATYLPGPLPDKDQARALLAFHDNMEALRPTTPPTAVEPKPPNARMQITFIDPATERAGEVGEMTSGRWDILAVENGWHGVNCARRWAVPEPCNCGLLELVVRIEREAVRDHGSEPIAKTGEGIEVLSFNHAEALQLDGPVVIAQSDTDPGDMGEPRMFVSDGVTHLTVPSFRLWGAIDCVLHDHTGPCIPEEPHP